MHCKMLLKTLNRIFRKLVINSFNFHLKVNSKLAEIILLVHFQMCRGNQISCRTACWSGGECDGGAFGKAGTRPSPFVVLRDAGQVYVERF